MKGRVHPSRMETPGEADPCILVLERDHPTRELILATMRDAGLFALGSWPPAVSPQSVRVVVVDVEEPRALGVQRLQQLRTQFQRARLLAISGRFQVPPGTANQVAAQMNADWVLAKPLDFNELLQHARRLLTDALE